MDSIKENGSAVAPPCPVTLGTTGQISICATLAYSPKFTFRLGKTKYQWACMTLPQQWATFHTVIKDAYLPHCHSIECYPELHKSGELHCHMLITIKDKVEFKEYYLSNLRKLVSQNAHVQRMTKGLKHAIITSNYIHHCDDVYKWLQYCKKDGDKIPLKPKYLHSIHSHLEKELALSPI